MDLVLLSSSRKVREGFMIKKGQKRHNWKTRWFVLFDNVLCYYKSNRDTVPKGEINLRGCSVVSPCPEYTKKDGVFRLIESSGRELLVQCDYESEREDWLSDIAEVIRTLESIGNEKQQVEPVSLMIQKRNAEVSYETRTDTILGMKVTCQEILDAMQDTDAGVPLSQHAIGQDNFKLCFTGMELIDWLISWAFAKTREDGHTIACDLLEKAYLHPIGPLSLTSFKRKQARKAFCDSEQALYRFSSLRFSGALDIDFYLDEDLDEDSSDSETETVPGTVNESESGQIIRQGFLVKKGHVRHNWKVRTFVLRDNPPMLYYHKPGKPKRSLKGRIRLNECEIREIGMEEDEEDVDVTCAKGCKKYTAHEHCFQIKTKKGTVYTLQATSQDELNNWMTSLEEVTQDVDVSDNESETS